MDGTTRLVSSKPMTLDGLLERLRQPDYLGADFSGRTFGGVADRYRRGAGGQGGWRDERPFPTDPAYLRIGSLFGEGWIRGIHPARPKQRPRARPWLRRIRLRPKSDYLDANGCDRRLNYHLTFGHEAVHAVMAHGGSGGTWQYWWFALLLVVVAVPILGGLALRSGGLLIAAGLIAAACPLGTVGLDRTSHGLSSNREEVTAEIGAALLAWHAHLADGWPGSSLAYVSQRLLGVAPAARQRVIEVAFAEAELRVAHLMERADLPRRV